MVNGEVHRSGCGRGCGSGETVWGYQVEHGMTMMMMIETTARARSGTGTSTGDGQQNRVVMGNSRESLKTKILTHLWELFWDPDEEVDVVPVVLGVAEGRRTSLSTADIRSAMPSLRHREGGHQGTSSSSHFESKLLSRS